MKKDLNNLTIKELLKYTRQLERTVAKSMEKDGFMRSAIYHKQQYNKLFRWYEELRIDFMEYLQETQDSES